LTGITLISGCPGSGKTTLSALLAERSERGVHVVTDQFYDFLARRIDPSTSAAHAQNSAVLRAFLLAARSFAEDGYEVFVDGVIGPWWLTDVARLCPDYHYVLLHTDLATALARTRQREGQPAASSGVVRVMHGQFEAIGDLDGWRIDTTGKQPEVVLAEYLMRRRAGGFGPVASSQVRR